ncbi:MAG: hypothetical protein M1484_00440 [Patescibacteria group bacterium]|nr:hypothetical protein [Patescibacteria group bacterium]MCL5431548.1 hypothetical protein [Patescibacteria group bacterium]
MVVFLFACLVALFIPGDIFIRRLNLTIFQRVVLALGLGLVLWALQGFILGYLNLRNLTYVYLTVAFLIWLKH